MGHTQGATCPVLAMRAYISHCKVSKRTALFHFQSGRPLSSKALPSILQDQLHRYDHPSTHTQSLWFSNGSGMGRTPYIHHPKIRTMTQLGFHNVLPLVCIVCVCVCGVCVCVLCVCCVCVLCVCCVCCVCVYMVCCVLCRNEDFPCVYLCLDVVGREEVGDMLRYYRGLCTWCVVCYVHVHVMLLCDNNQKCCVQTCCPAFGSHLVLLNALHMCSVVTMVI